jgi:hypothetical protein
MMESFTLAKVFSTSSKFRDELGERITTWLRETRVKVIDTVVVQSSDSAHHCVSIIVFATYET